MHHGMFPCCNCEKDGTTYLDRLNRDEQLIHGLASMALSMSSEMSIDESIKHVRDVHSRASERSFSPHCGASTLSALALSRLPRDLLMLLTLQAPALEPHRLEVPTAVIDSQLRLGSNVQRRLK